MGVKSKAIEEVTSSLLFGVDGRFLVILFFSLSISVKILFYHTDTDQSHEGVNESTRDLPYAEDHEDFLQLVEPHYKDEDLFEWEPAAKVEGDPNEPGYLGKPVVLTPEEQEAAQLREKENYFNVIASEMISPNRTLADFRVPECSYVTYPKKLPQTSVIIVFHNEAWSTLTRTIWSVYRKSPRALLKEIILVDDKSDQAYLRKQLQAYVAEIPVKVLLLRTLTRTGLIQARLLGVKFSTAPTVTFLDAHCECNEGWLEPLLARLAENRQTAVAPLIGSISSDTFGIEESDFSMRYSVFSWRLTFKWSETPLAEMERINFDRAAVFRTPAMAGGLFAIDREYFYKVGAYDEQMRIWGGENIEMSIRLWTCGGSVETAQCSLVGHVFRSQSPHSFPGGSQAIISRNLARVADVWMDEWSEFYYTATPAARMRRTDVGNRKELRKKLKCKSFRWYLENIYPTSVMRTEDINAIVEVRHIPNMNACSDVPMYSKAVHLEYITSTLGQFVFAFPSGVSHDGLCIDTYGRRSNGSIKVEDCHHFGGNQAFLLTKRHEVRADELCMDAVDVGSPVKLWPCHEAMGSQEWVYNNKTEQFQHSNGQNCLTINTDDLELMMEPCSDSSLQKWTIAKVPKIERDVPN